MTSKQGGYTALPSDSNPGPFKSVDGYVIAVTGLHEEVSQDKTKFLTIILCLAN